MNAELDRILSDVRTREEWDEAADIGMPYIVSIIDRMF